MLDLLRQPRLRLAERVLPRIPLADVRGSEILREALNAPEIRGLVNWARFPFVEVRRTGDHYEVFVMDARFTRAPAGRFGWAKVVIRGSDQPTGQKSSEAGFGAEKK
jgi:hypothetical protein